MPCCVLKKCDNNTRNSNKSDGITYHTFPGDITTREKWIRLVQSEKNDIYWLPLKDSRICSAHFNADNIYLTKKGRRFLKKKAVPTIELESSSPEKKNTSAPASPISFGGKSDLESLLDTHKKTTLHKQIRKLSDLKTKHFAKINLLQRKNKRLKNKITTIEGILQDVKMSYRCCVPGCGELMKPLCRLPKDQALQRDWLRVIGNPELISRSASSIYENYRICRKHFTDEAFRNLRYKHKCYGFYGKMNTAPTLHLPTEIIDLFPYIIDLDNSELNLKEQIKPSVQKEYSKQDDIPMTYVESLIECADTKNNLTHDHLEHSTKQGPRTYQRTIKMEPIDNEQINIKKENPFESYTEIEISDLHESETFVSACNIKEESIDREPNTKLCETDEEHVRDECEIFGKHIITKLKSYERNTRTVVKNLIDDILFKAENGMY